MILQGIAATDIKAGQLVTIDEDGKISPVPIVKWKWKIQSNILFGSEQSSQTIEAPLGSMVVHLSVDRCHLRIGLHAWSCREPITDLSISIEA